MSNPILSKLAGGAGRSSQPTQSNPMQMIAQARRSGMSPMQFIQRMPKTQQTQEAMQILSGDERQLKTTAERLAQQRGINLGEFIKQARSMF